MSIKIAHPENPILLEGLWGLGKTELAQAYSLAHGYRVISEPLHTSVLNHEEIKNLDTWYLNAHQRQEDYLEKSSLIIMERSVLSTFAFSYALERALPNESYLLSLKNIIQENKVLVVYLKINEDFSFTDNTDIQKYSADIQRILLDKRARARYQEWYEVILPRECGVLPFKLRMTMDNLRRPVKALVEDIYSCLSCDRIAQINAVCFYKNPEKKELEFLVLKRNKKKGGFWQTVTGGIHPGESPLSAVKREIYEETNISEKQINAFWTHFDYSFIGKDNYELDEYVFECEIKNIDLLKISNEHEAFQWLSYDKAKKILTFKENKKAIDIIYNEIGQSHEELP